MLIYSCCHLSVLLISNIILQLHVYHLWCYKANAWILHAITNWDKYGSFYLSFSNFFLHFLKHEEIIHLTSSVWVRNGTKLRNNWCVKMRVGAKNRKHTIGFRLPLNKQQACTFKGIIESLTLEINLRRQHKGNWKACFEPLTVYFLIVSFSLIKNGQVQHVKGMFTWNEKMYTLNK